MSSRYGKPRPGEGVEEHLLARIRELRAENERLREASVANNPTQDALEYQRLTLAQVRHIDEKHRGAALDAGTSASLDLLLGEVVCKLCGHVVAYTDERLDAEFKRIRS